jgi:hypothetical protein
MPYRTHPITDSGKSQADGAFVVSLSGHESAESYQLNLEVSAEPNAGTLAVGVRAPGGTDYYTIGTIDMTDATERLLIIKDLAVASIQFTPSNFDAAKTYSVIVTARRLAT